MTLTPPDTWSFPIFLMLRPFPRLLPRYFYFVYCLFFFLPESDQKVAPIPFIGSGMVSPAEKGVSVPYIVEVDEKINLNEEQVGKGKMKKEGKKNAKKEKSAKEMKIATKDMRSNTESVTTMSKQN